MPVEIRRVEGRKGLKAFVRFPYSIYRDDPHWVPALDMDDIGTLSPGKNPAFEYCEATLWMAYRDGVAVGRVAGIVNRRYIEKWGKKWARFGWLDFIEDREVAAALMKAVEDWAREKGLEGLHGPLGFTDLDREGMLVEGFEELATYATNYNKPYYPEYLAELGYVKDVDWLEFSVRTPKEMPEKVKRVQELISKRAGVRIHEWKSKKALVATFAGDLFELLDEAYYDLYGTVPLTEAQVRFYIKTYLGFVDPRFTKVLVDGDDKLIGFGITMPSLSRAAQKAKGRLFPFGWLHILAALRHPKTIDMYLVAVKPEYQARGVVAFLLGAIIADAIEAGVECAETNLELETNLQVQGLWKDYEKRQHKRRRAFFKQL
jgi:ribosomal protein S18 acetylase RimI-like enzyme